MELRITIVDDQTTDRERLQADICNYFSNAAHHCTIQCFSDAQQMLNRLEHAAGVCQIAFLDICMEGMNGIQLAQKLRARDTKMLIIFLTTSREYAFDAFPVHPFDYLIKPYTPKQLFHVLEEAMRTILAQDPDPEILVRAAYSSYHIPYDKIISVLSYGHSVEIYTTENQCIRSIMTFSELEEKLTKDPRFLFCNRGVLVNMDHVLRLDKDTFHMKDGPSCTLRVRDRARLISQFSQYLITRMKRGVSR